MFQGILLLLRICVWVCGTVEKKPTPLENILGNIHRHSSPIFQAPRRLANDTAKMLVSLIGLATLLGMASASNNYEKQSLSVSYSKEDGLPVFGTLNGTVTELDEIPVSGERNLSFFWSLFILMIAENDLTKMANL